MMKVRNWLRPPVSILWALLLACTMIAMAKAQTSPPVPSFNSSQLQIPATGADFNTLINRINAILVPALGSGSGLVNLIGISGGTTGNNVVIGLQPGADANAGITINPNGSGNIQLFGVFDTGGLQFGNQAGWYPAKSAGLIPCPGGGPTGPGFTLSLLPGGAQTVAGYELHKDWLGRAYWVPGCRDAAGG